MLSELSFDHLVSAHFVREQPNADGTDQHDYQPRSPQRRLQQYDINKLSLVNRTIDFSANAFSGLSLEKSEQSAPNANHRRPQTDQISGTCQKKSIDNRTERARHEEQSEQRTACHYAPFEKR